MRQPDPVLTKSSREPQTPKFDPFVRPLGFKLFVTAILTAARENWRMIFNRFARQAIKGDTSASLKRDSLRREAP